MKVTRETVKEWVLVTFATLLIAAGTYFFKFPNHFSPGGVTGLSVILGHYFPQITPGDFVLAINMLLLLVGFAVFGKFVIALVTAGLGAAILEELTGFVIIPGLAPLSEGFQTVGSIAIVLAGAFPLVFVITKLLKSTRTARNLTVRTLTRRK